MITIGVLFLLLLILGLSESVTIPSFIRSDLVLQHGKPIKFWGESDCVGTSITVNVFDSSGNIVSSGSTVALATWSIILDRTLDHSTESHSIQISDCDSTETIPDVLIGEVILCSGQSNMEKEMFRQLQSEIDIVKADAPNFPYIRFWDVTESQPISNPRFDLTSTGNYFWIKNNAAILEDSRAPGATCYYTVYWLSKYWKDEKNIEINDIIMDNKR